MLMQLTQVTTILLTQHKFLVEYICQSNQGLGTALLITTPSAKANRIGKAVNTFAAEEVIVMYQYNIAQIRAKIRAAQWRAEQEAKRRLRELERKLKQALRK